MRLQKLFVVFVFAVLWSSTSFVRADGKLEEIASLPEGLSKEVAAVVDAKGQRVVDKGGAVCSVWLVKEVPTKANFKPTLSVKYPFAPGELLVSREADVYPQTHPERADLVDGSIGEGSPFEREYGYYAHGVGPETAVLPAGWEGR